MRARAGIGGGGGFTLVELLVVILILGVLAAIAVPSFMGQRTKAVLTEAESNLQILRMLEEQFFAENGEYAPNDKGTSGTLTAVANIQSYLKGFKPGDTNSLKFEYSIIYTVSGGITNSFTAMATGKNGTAAAGKCFQLNAQNQYGTCP